MEEYDYLFKVIVLGDGGVGKTALTVRFAQGYFQESYKMTVGVDFSVKLIEVERPEGATKVKLQVWDTGGQERFSFVRPLYYRGAMGALLVFDVTNRESFDHLPNWIEELESNADPVPFVLVGNKVDLPRQVSSEEAWEFAQQFNIKYYYETSAKTGEEVGDCFHALAYEMIGIPLPQADYPPVMEALGAAPGSSAVTASQPEPAPAAATIPTPQMAPEPTFDFGSADEYADFDEPSTPAPQPVSVPKPQPVSVPKPEPVNVPKIQPVTSAKPSPISLPKMQPVKKESRAAAKPKVQPLPKPTPISIPKVQPLPKPEPISVPKVAPVTPPKPQVPQVPDVPAAKKQESKPQSLGLFQAPESIAEEEPPMEMPEMPGKKPSAQRVAKPIPVEKKKVETAMPAIKSISKSEISSEPVIFKPTAEKEKAEVEKPAAAGPIIFEKSPIKSEKATQTTSVSTSTSEVEARNNPLFYLSQALSARSKGGNAPVKSSSGTIPFSVGFTAKKQVGTAANAGGDSGAMGMFIQAAVPDDLKNPKKKKKKKKKKGGSGGGGADVSDIIKCPGCGYSISSKMRFCNKCGTKLK